MKPGDRNHNAHRIEAEPKKKPGILDIIASFCDLLFGTGEKKKTRHRDRR